MSITCIVLYTHCTPFACLSVSARHIGAERSTETHVWRTD